MCFTSVARNHKWEGRTMYVTLTSSVLNFFQAIVTDVKNNKPDLLSNAFSCTYGER